MAEQDPKQDIAFTPQQRHAFKRLFAAADAVYKPDGMSFWYRSSGFRFRLSCDTTGYDLPEDYKAPNAILAVDHTMRADSHEDTTTLKLTAGNRSVSYASDRRRERS